LLINEEETACLTGSEKRAAKRGRNSNEPWATPF